MERNEFQTRTKLEAQIASTERELALAKKKLEHEEEERDKRREAWEQRVTSQYCNGVHCADTQCINLCSYYVKCVRLQFYIKFCIIAHR